jgi:hypothetical protein
MDRDALAESSREQLIELVRGPAFVEARAG